MDGVVVGLCGWVFHKREIYQKRVSIRIIERYVGRIQQRGQIRINIYTLLG